MELAMNRKATLQPIGAPDWARVRASAATMMADAAALPAEGAALTARERHRRREYRRDGLSAEEIARREAQSKGDRASNPNQLLSRDDIQAEFGLSRRWLELAAVRGDGPPMIRISWKMVRYRRADFEAWLASREVRNTSQPVGAGA